MKKHITTLFWILTDALIIFAIPFFPSVFSIFSIITAIILAPIDIWQDFLSKHLNKPIKTIIIALGVAFVIALFPISPIVTSIHKLLNPETYSPQNISSIVYYEESSNTNNFTYDITSTSTNLTVTSEKSETSSENNTNVSTSKEVERSSKETKSEYSSRTTQDSNKNKEITNSNSVYRTPSGKRYHQSPTCGGKNSYKIAYDDAISSGLTPCKRCVK